MQQISSTIDKKRKLSRVFGLKDKEYEQLIQKELEDHSLVSKTHEISALIGRKIDFKGRVHSLQTLK